MISIFTTKLNQGGITCGAIEEASRTSKTIDKRVITNYSAKNAVIAHFREKMIFLFVRQKLFFHLYDKTDFFICTTKMSYVMIYHDMS